MRTGVAPDELIHVYNRGVLKQPIFFDHRDYARFLFLILFLQSKTVAFENLTRPINYFIKNSKFNITAKTITEIIRTRDVELVAFILMPNHFHLIVKEVNEGGLAKYFQRIGNSFTKYKNARYKTSGHLFQSRYQSVHIQDNDQLLYKSAYIHKHIFKIDHKWSSFQDYVKENRWSELLSTSLILDQFNNPAEYHQWLRDCSAKEIAENVGHSMSNI